MSGRDFSHKPIEVDKVSTKYRTIKTSIPVPESIPLLKKKYSLEAQAMHGQFPMIWDKADDFQIFDKWGNIWIDFTSTIFVANAGHGNKNIVKALKGVLYKPLIHTYTYASQERIDYLDYLIESTHKQFEKAILLYAGSEYADRNDSERTRLLVEATEPFLKGEYKTAIKIFDEILEIHPNDSEIFEMKGVALSNLRLGSTLAAQPQQNSSPHDASTMNKLSMLCLLYTSDAADE